MANKHNQFDFLVFIGRFQPFHLGHQRVVEQALEHASKLIILIGSAYRPRCTRNPWSFNEREQMIRSTLSEQHNKRVIITPLMDATYNDDLWTTTIQKCVSGITATHHPQPHREPSVGLIGHSKDHTSYYLKLFPQWGSVNVGNINRMSATDIRHKLFHADQGHWEDKRLPVADLAGDLVPEPVLDYLNTFVRSETFAKLRDEFDFVKTYQSAWNNTPYPPMFVTVDAIVIQSGHILLVERGARPGKGLWALPGGFVNQNESLQAACLRELKEETRLKVPVAVLKGCIQQQSVFDDPYRSERGRTITHAFFIHLQADTMLPKVKGGDDANKAFWVPLANINPERMFEDHYFIIQRMLGQIS
ncbi:MAG: bifunctional nicotinamide-nucleotide adenylyltransferase/Nudix hydroxylase [Gammaproteobacteria bacterium]|nr:bifunctional nicotinamide-nucleotide adenylyltransferase/Nudix hydroxylase [Gammaproteobacteria bacterium]